MIADLRRLAGKTWLWERPVVESKEHRPNPEVQSRTEYDPSTWRWAIQNLFREFNRGKPVKSQLRPHDLRARAFTLIAAATQSVDATAQAMGADRQTARHYLEAESVRSERGSPQSSRTETKKELRQSALNSCCFSLCLVPRLGLEPRTR